jgi:hypothetical protein
MGMGLGIDGKIPSSIWEANKRLLHPAKQINVQEEYLSSSTDSRQNRKRTNEQTT